MVKIVPVNRVYFIAYFLHAMHRRRETWMFTEPMWAAKRSILEAFVSISIAVI